MLGSVSMRDAAHRNSNMGMRMTESLKLTDGEHDALARRLHDAIRSGVGIDPPSDSIDFTFEDAYRIRRKLVDYLIVDGGRPRGHKIGFTSVAMQEMYGMSGPDFGQLLDDMFVSHGAPVAVGHLSDTRVEPEIAFEMAQPLEGPGVTIEQVLESTARVWASIEVIDSRVGAMRAKAVDSIADNAGAGKVVLGARPHAPLSFPLDSIEVTLCVDGEWQQGVSGDVMGHPAAAVAWLANRLFELDGLGGRIREGDIIMSGSSTRSVAVRPGSKLEADFGPLGKMEVLFA